MDFDIEDAFADIAQKFDEAENIVDEQERSTRMRVLETNLVELRKDAAQEEEDLAQAVFGLNALLESMGEDYSNLGQPSEAEQGMVGDAQARLATAETALEEADEVWFQFRRDNAKAEAQTQIDSAKLELEQAKKEAARSARQRLLKADMEQSLQEFMLRVEKTTDIMQTRMGQLDQQLEIVANRKSEAFSIKEQAAETLQKLDEELTREQDSLAREEELLNALENGSPDHARQTQTISNLRADVEELRGRRNTALILFQSKEKFAAELEIHEKTQMKLRDNQRMWITSLRSDTEERVITFKSRLEAMKAAADQDIAKEMDDLGSAVDQSNAEYMAAVGAASDRLRMDKIEDHPERIAKMMEVQAAQAEALQRIIEREGQELEKFRKMYGIDPTKSSFFSYGDPDSTEEAQDSGVF